MKPARVLGWSIVCGIAVLAMAIATPLHAYDMGDKACRGAAGLFAGVLELPGNMVDISNKKGVLLGCTEGFIKGVIMAPIREIIGVYELFTFPFGCGNEYKPLLEPDYPWCYFRDDAKGPGTDPKKN